MRGNNKGFTVVELIVSVALLAIILVPTASFFTNSFRIQGRTSMKTSITRVGQYVIENFKNKNYLGLTINDGTIGEEKGLKDYINLKKISGLDFSGNGLSITDSDGWELEYNNVKYNIDIKLKALTEFDNSSLNIPKESDCCGTVEINSLGNFGVSNSDIECYEKGANISAPPFGEAYSADYPTIILRGSNVKREADGTVNLWLRNTGYGYMNGTVLTKEKEIRIIKDFEEQLFVIIEGVDLGIEEGPKSINVSKDYYNIRSLSLGEERNLENENNLGEVVFDAEMVVTNASDNTIRDSFNFSFAVDYDYSN